MRAGLREIVARAGVPGVVTGFGSVYVSTSCQTSPS
jgi:hypothetical protein